MDSGIIFGFRDREFLLRPLNPFFFPFNILVFTVDNGIAINLDEHNARRFQGEGFLGAKFVILVYRTVSFIIDVLLLEHHFLMFLAVSQSMQRYHEKAI